MLLTAWVRRVRIARRDWSSALAVGCALAAGCNGVPRIDPTGERFFVRANQPAPGYPAPMFPAQGYPIAGSPVNAYGPYSPYPAAPLTAIGQWGVAVSPGQVIAPIGSEVILVATVIGPEGYTWSSERVEWMISPESVGQISSPGDRRFFEIIQLLRGVPRKVDPRYAINSTLVVPQTLDRGTPIPTDDVTVLEGQSWVTVSSPTEGTSRVTVFAPDLYAWDRRQQTASIYWVDAQWRFPPPAIAAAGGRQTLTTMLSRQSDGAPLAGWLIGYRIAAGPAAGFAPDGAAEIQVQTSETGEASAELLQSEALAGTNQIEIQVIRPAGLGGQGRSLPVGSGSTLQTWTSGTAATPTYPRAAAPSYPPALQAGPMNPAGPTNTAGQRAQLAVRATGPAQAGVGETVTYRLEVSNSSGAPATNVMLVEQASPGLTFVNSDPAAETGAGPARWSLGMVPARESRVIEANYRVAGPGTVNFCVTASGANAPPVRECVLTRAAAPQLEILANGPPRASVGAEVRFDIQIINRSQQAVRNLIVSDRFDRGLEHAVATSPIEREIGELAPGQATRLPVTFRVLEPGELCQEISVRGEGGLQASTRKCLTATGTAAEPPTRMPENFSFAPLGSSATDAPVGAAKLTVRTPDGNRQRVGEDAKFKIDIVNNSDRPLTNLLIANNFDVNLEAKEATEPPSVSWQGSALVWKIDRLETAGTLHLEIVFHCLHESPRACNRVKLSADGIAPLVEEACVEIVGDEPARARPQAAPTGGSVRVSVADTADPVKVGGETMYQVVLENTGTASALNVALAATFGDELRFQGASGPERCSVSQSGLKFNAIRELRGGETVSFEIRMQALRPGTARFRTEVTTGADPKPATAEQTTDILQ